MVNCLKQTLKGQVNNDNLPVYGANTLNIKYLANATNFALGLQPTADDDIVLKCRDGVAHLTLDGNTYSEYTIAKGSLSLSMTFENADYIIDIYGIRYGSVKAINYKSDCIYTNLENLISYSNPDKTLTFKVQSKNIEGDVSVLGSMTSVTNLSLEGCNVHGDVSVFGKMKSLSALNFAGTKVSGSIESLVASWLSGTPKTLATPMLIYGLPLLSFGSFEYLPSAYTYLIYNNAGTKIAMYYGGNSSGYDSCPTVYIKGYKNDGTDSEYNTNIGSGGIWESKTVIDVTTGDTWHSPA